MTSESKGFGNEKGRQVRGDAFAGPPSTPPERVEVVSAPEPKRTPRPPDPRPVRVTMANGAAALAKRIMDRRRTLNRTSEVPATKGREPKAPIEAVLKAQEAGEKLAELDKSYERLDGMVESLRQQLGDKDETITILEERMERLRQQMKEVRERCTENRSVPLSSLEQIEGAIIRITIITLLGGFVGGPLLALATKSLLGEKIIEGTVAAFVASASTEVANRAADPTSHRHHD